MTQRPTSAPIDSALAAFGFDPAGVRRRVLAGGLSGAPVFAIETPQGAFVLKRWPPEKVAYAARVAALQERARAAGAPLPAHRSEPPGPFVRLGATVQALAPGRPLEAWSQEQARAFGRALGRLDAALSRILPDPAFADQADVFSRCKDVDHVEAAYLDACDDRFPEGYRRHLVEILGRLRTEQAALADVPRVTTHVDANPENALFDDAGAVTLIDLTPELRHPGYSLGAALYWWAYPWQTDSLDLGVLASVTAGYLSEHVLEGRLRTAVAGHMLNHSLMELAFPLGCLVDGPPPGARPMEDLTGRLRRAETLYGRLEEIKDRLAAA